MTQKVDSFKASVLKGNEKSAIRWRIPVAVIGLTVLVLVLVALAVLMVTSSGNPAVLPQDEDSRFVTNPELSVSRRYSRPVAASSLLGDNPELSISRRYSHLVEPESSLLGDNPELIISRRYSRLAATEDRFLADNPEVMIARRYWSRWLSEAARVKGVSGE